MTGAYLASGYKRVKIQTGSIVMEKLPSPEVTTTFDNPSVLGCEVI